MSYVGTYLQLYLYLFMLRQHALVVYRSPKDQKLEFFLPPAPDLIFGKPFKTEFYMTTLFHQQSMEWRYSETQRRKKIQDNSFSWIGYEQCLLGH
jgi:hypothetical protein